ncbi:hypothetical protein FCV25MIE_00371 [Fagus crenata]
METEENLETDLFDPRIPPINDQSFAEKLREIDTALNFSQGTCMEKSSVIFGDIPNSSESHQPPKQSNPKPTPPNQDPIPARLPLGDINNTPLSPKITQAQPVWKRISRTQSAIKSPELKLPSKRAGSLSEEPGVVSRKWQEVICEDDGLSFASAAAVHQPRRPQ